VNAEIAFRYSSSKNVDRAGKLKKALQLLEHAELHTTEDLTL